MSGGRSGPRLRNIIRLLEQGMEDVRGLSKALSEASLLDRLMCAVLGTGGSPHRGHLAVKGILGHFVDWNEVRVSAPTSVSEATAAAGIPGAAARARAAIEFLDGLFRRYGSIGLQFLKDAGPSDMKRFAATVSGEDKLLYSTLSLVAFDLPVVPPTPSLQRVCIRLGVCPSSASTQQCARKIQTSLPQETLRDAYNLLETLAERYCRPGLPDCRRCPVSAGCPSARKFLKAAEAGASGASAPPGKRKAPKARGADAARAPKRGAARDGKKK